MNTNAFIYGAAQSIGDTAIAYSLTAARWGVLGAEWYYETFLSARATARYRVIGEILGHCLILAVIGWRMAQEWAAAEVEGAIADDVVIEDMTMLTEAEHAAHPNAEPLTETEHDLVDALLEETYKYERMTIRQLKAAARGKVRGYSKMDSQQLREALRAA